MKGSEIVDRVTKVMFETILKKLDKFDILEDRFDGLEKRFDGLEQRFVGLENEIKDFRAEMKDQIKGLDGKMDIIYNKLKSDIDDLKPKLGSKYTIVKEE